mmetsp:Transcript_47671/g.111600  ORF Transcript_47671/g.111600 Transcript_47671/m.111600 type:complete len:547 (-) Transcript_47671:108-1748(-)
MELLKAFQQVEGELIVCACVVLETLLVLKLFVLLLQSLYRSPCQGGERNPVMREVWRGCKRGCNWVKTSLGHLAGPTSKPIAEAWDSLQRRLLLYFSRSIMVCGMYRIIAVQVWYFQGKSRRHPSVDLPLLGSFAVLLMVSTFPCFQTRIAMDILFWLLQLLSIVSMLLAQPSDTTQVVVLTVVLRTVASLWVRSGWWALIAYLPNSIYVVYSAPMSRGSSLAASLGVALAIITLRHFMYKTVELCFDLRAKTIKLDAVSALMTGFCDCVVHLDRDLKLLEDSPRIAALLLCGASNCSRGASFLELVCEDDRGRVRSLFTDSFAAPVTHSLALNVRLVDSDSNQVKVEMMHIPFFDEQGEPCHLLCLRESDDVTTASTVAPLQRDTVSATLVNFGGATEQAYVVFDAMTFDILLASSDFEALFAKCTGHAANLEEMSVHDLPTDVGEPSLSRRIQLVVNSFYHNSSNNIDLGVFQFFGACKMQVRVELQHDPALATLVGTLHVTPTNPGLLLQPQVHVGRRKKTRSHYASPHPLMTTFPTRRVIEL